MRDTKYGKSRIVLGMCVNGRISSLMKLTLGSQGHWERVIMEQNYYVSYRSVAVVGVMGNAVADTIVTFDHLTMTNHQTVNLAVVQCVF